ncbi:unnamed protein product [Pedinophyceae sp. YPF-701]|nr:unnamed protein product [Pedinophyceae sp. YPF-701]
MPRARRVILPDASHSALLERGVDLVQILRHNAVLPARHGRQADQDGGHAGGARGAEEDAWDEGSRSDGVGPTGVPRATMEQWEAARRNLAPLRALTDPVMLGTENIPLPGGPREQLQRPVLLVGNHTQYGFYDLPLLLQLLYDRGVKARGLGHPGHWQSPLGTLFERFGAVPANGRNMLKLLSRNECVLLFPGGAREVNKRKGEAYRLFWSDTPDLVRIAARANAIIVPFTALGGDDAFELFMDTDEVLNAPVLGPAVKTLYSTFAPFLEIEESVYPVPALPLPKWLPGPRLPFPLPVPRIQRIYFKFHAPVDVGARCCAPRAPGRGRARPDVEKCAEVYAEVQDTIRGGVSELQELRARDPGRFLSVRLLAQARAYLPDAGLPDGRADPRRQV